MTRIDQAHGPLRADCRLPEIPRVSPPEEIAAAAGFVRQRVLAQVQAQAEQLAEHLGARQRELDQREAQLNARCLELETETRAFRLWASQREEALGERERALQQQSAELTDRAARMGTAEEALAGQRQTTAELATAQAVELPAGEASAQRERELVEGQRPAALRAQSRTLEHWLRRRQTELAQRGPPGTTPERSMDSPRWRSGELQQQWTKQRQEFLRELRDALGRTVRGRPGSMELVGAGS